MKRNAAIGLFDSGVGGLSVAVEIYRQMPAESTVYYGDTAHVPYGPRSAEELTRFTKRITDFLQGQGVKYIIAACNTSSSMCLPVLKESCKVPIIGLIEPGVKEALSKTVNGKIGVIATEATIRSGAYEHGLKKLGKDIEVYSQAAPRLVPLVETGRTDTYEVTEALREYLSPLQKAGIDTLILGCTHYPFLARQIEEELGPGVRLVDPALATVRAAKEELCRLGLAINGVSPVSHCFYVSGRPDAFRAAAVRFLKKDIGPVKQVIL
ncbi:MAG TPA: glutamate racemase [Bacillota bacterium]|nr:glutamate racemase [Peptococcaceae bacterium MAG4]NLW38707.1 glutamate racemase [Peptococcaceae bacterium]HPZ44064.1 glutamate racemase [Bacillota bacterium]HQD75187.1 glutamate racemase [Bacillota bacterium]HUM58001.1 glutamate racemase [Bacillota bacterium]